ncbi:GNAT family N-acetyltransferase [Streptomyces sp. NBC_00690]|uniref:GNAT family N-acetyltransferase n=1 Tax=Streptomyces sp. NBC_00690 TaxID=2975808 RepID=UPI002E28D34E|nr:GNAT family N-acetyltransferase [Streptomyces sp. NBC_00690]
MSGPTAWFSDTGVIRSGPGTTSADTIPGSSARSPSIPHPPAPRDVSPGAATPTHPLDDPAHWAATLTPAGRFQLEPVSIERDLRRLSRWMNDPAVSAYWELAGPPSITLAHVRQQLDGDGRSVPCLGLLDGRAMSYFEIYRADLDPLGRYYSARTDDTGIHVLIGSDSDRGRGLGSVLIRAVADLVLDHRPRCGRVLAEPDIRNTPSLAAFLAAGFRYSSEIDLPDKRAALLVRDRGHRNQL